MNIRKHRKTESEVNTHSLNDIMFFLMLFFLIASTMATPNVIKLLLPKANSSQVMTKKEIKLSITADDEYFIESKKVAFTDLKAELSKEIKGATEATVTIRIDGGQKVQKLVDVLEIGASLNVKMLIAADKR
jgi:biopolymer transport protein ExbD